MSGVLWQLSFGSDEQTAWERRLRSTGLLAGPGPGSFSVVRVQGIQIYSEYNEEGKITEMPLKA